MALSPGPTPPVRGRGAMGAAKKPAEVAGIANPDAPGDRDCRSVSASRRRLSAIRRSMIHSCDGAPGAAAHERREMARASCRPRAPRRAATAGSAWPRSITANTSASRGSPLCLSSPTTSPARRARSMRSSVRCGERRLPMTLQRAASSVVDRSDGLVPCGSARVRAAVVPAVHRSRRAGTETAGDAIRHAGHDASAIHAQCSGIEEHRDSAVGAVDTCRVEDFTGRRDVDESQLAWSYQIAGKS